MARRGKELPINKISYQFVGTEEDLIKVCVWIYQA